MPRFSEENFPKNLKLVHELETLAGKKGCTPGQVAIAWVKAKSGKEGLPVLIPIPGATTPARIRENAVEVELSVNDVKELDSLVESIEVVGGRYPDGLAALNFGNTPPLKE